mmetsp:Transcript_4094/g.18569  ORF Transcript_4094/g.18569 Transcript_4094/m.18569 type:complete len:283 (+) Transcript_4094:2336-3184(+)
MKSHPCILFNTTEGTQRLLSRIFVESSEGRRRRLVHRGQYPLFLVRILAFLTLRLQLCRRRRLGCPQGSLVLLLPHLRLCPLLRLALLPNLVQRHHHVRGVDAFLLQDLREQISGVGGHPDADQHQHDCLKHQHRLRLFLHGVALKRRLKQQRTEVRVHECRLGRADEVRREELGELERGHAAHVPVTRQRDGQDRAQPQEQGGFEPLSQRPLRLWKLRRVEPAAERLEPLALTHRRVILPLEPERLLPQHGPAEPKVETRRHGGRERSEKRAAQHAPKHRR